MFSTADAYERFMGRWSAKLAPQLAQFAGVRDGDTVLDVGCGTGSLALAAHALAPGGRIVGIDTSAAFVDFAAARHQAVTFQVGDAQRLPFDDGSFDRTLSMLILNFIPDRNAAVREMRRVTKPGGIVAAAVWDYGQGMEMLRLFWDAAITVIPESDRRDERHMPLCRPGELDALWRAHDLVHVAEDGIEIEQRFASFDDYWLPFLEQQGPAGAFVASLPDDARSRVRDTIRQRLIGDDADRPITLTARAWAVRGQVPAPTN